MPSPKRALVVTSLENLGLAVIRSLSNKGFQVTVAGAGAGWMLRLSRHCSRYVRVAQTGVEMSRAEDGGLERAARLARARDVDLVVPVDVPGELFAAKLRPLLPERRFFPFAQPETLRRLDNKWTFYEFLMEHGLPAPRSRLLSRAEDARGLGFPAILKPLSEAGGKGVEVVKDDAALAARLASGRGRLGLPLIAQEFIEGEDVSLSFFADRGRLIAWSVHMRRRDTALEYIDDDRVVELGRRIAAASAYTGMANVDMRYDGAARSRVLVLECNPRFWGTFKYTAGIGVDYMGLGLELAAGGAPAPIARAPTALCPGLIVTAKRYLAGDLSTTDASRAYLREKLGDPVPEIYYGACKMLGVEMAGP